MDGNENQSLFCFSLVCFFFRRRQLTRFSIENNFRHDHWHSHFTVMSDPPQKDLDGILMNSVDCNFQLFFFFSHHSHFSIIRLLLFYHSYVFVICLQKSFITEKFMRKHNIIVVVVHVRQLFFYRTHSIISFIQFRFNFVEVKLFFLCQIQRTTVDIASGSQTHTHGKGKCLMIWILYVSA